MLPPTFYMEISRKAREYDKLLGAVGLENVAERRRRMQRSKITAAVWWWEAKEEERRRGGFLKGGF